MGTVLPLPYTTPFYLVIAVWKEESYCVKEPEHSEYTVGISLCSLS